MNRNEIEQKASGMSDLWSLQATSFEGGAQAAGDMGDFAHGLGQPNEFARVDARPSREGHYKKS